MTLCIAESYLESGSLVPEDLSARFEAWELVGRGRGHTCIAACQNLRRGLPWYESGVSSAGNGAAMRAAPVGLANPTDTAMLVHDAALSTVITHHDAMAVASAVAQAFLVARLVNTPFGTLDVTELMSELSTLLDHIDDPGHPERKPGASGHPVRLVDRILFVASNLAWPPDRLFAMTHNGAFVLESLPAAIWCFLRTPEDSERVIVTAANMGYDADTVAAMAGNLAGAYVGESRLPSRWLTGLEYADGIRDVADGLLALAGGTLTGGEGRALSNTVPSRSFRGGVRPPLQLQPWSIHHSRGADTPRQSTPTRRRRRSTQMMPNGYDCFPRRGAPGSWAIE